MKVAQSVSSRFAGAGIAQGALVAFLVKLGGSSLNIVMFTIAARIIGPAEFGQFAIWFNLVSFLAIIALCGQETLIVRSWNEYTHQHRYDLARGAILFGIVVCASAALFCAGCVAAGSSVAGWGAVTSAGQSTPRGISISFPGSAPYRTAVSITCRL